MHMNKYTHNDLESQFQSGVNLVLMMGLLDGYYIPHYLWHYTPKNFEERVSANTYDEQNTKSNINKR